MSESRTSRTRRTAAYLLRYHGPLTAVELSLRTRVKEKILRRILRHAWFASEVPGDSPTVFSLSDAGELALAGAALEAAPAADGEPRAADGEGRGDDDDH